MIIDKQSLDTIKNNALDRYYKKYKEEYPIEQLKVLDVLVGKFAKDEPLISLYKDKIKVAIDSKNLEYMLTFEKNSKNEIELYVTVHTPSDEFLIHKMILKGRKDL